MSKFTPPKAKRTANMWVPLPSAKVTVATTNNATPTTANPKMNTTTNPTITSTCRICKRLGPPSQFCSKSAPHPSPQECDWLDEDWDGDRQRAREQEKKVDSLATTTNTITTAAHTDVDCLSDTETAPICKLCKTIGDPCPFEIKPAQPPSHLESEDWTKEEEKKTKENEVPNDYYPTSPVYDPHSNRTPYPTTPQRRRWP